MEYIYTFVTALAKWENFFSECRQRNIRANSYHCFVALHETQHWPQHDWFHLILNWWMRFLLKKETLTVIIPSRKKSKTKTLTKFSAAFWHLKSCIRFSFSKRFIKFYYFLILYPNGVQKRAFQNSVKHIIQNIYWRIIACLEEFIGLYIVYVW